MIVVALSIGIVKAAGPSLIAGDSLNLKIIRATATEIATTPKEKIAHNWFAGRFNNLDIEKEFHISVEMAGNDTLGNKGNVAKWNGLWPVFTYADPNLYDAYIGFFKNERGVWESLDPFLAGDARMAGNGPVPRQTVMPKAVAAEFLTEKGTKWFPWREITKTEVDTKRNVFTMRQKFALPSATIAMRVPYTFTFEQEFLKRLREARLPGVFIDEIGPTSEGRKLYSIRLEDIADATPLPQRRTIAVFAREHATEHASSWAAHGMLLYLLHSTPQIDEMRAHVTWIIVPLEDPDGSAQSRFDGMTDLWLIPKGPKEEVFSYAGYFRDWADKGRTLDLSVSIHNVEANESENLMAPIAQSYYWQPTLEINQKMFETAKQEGFSVSKPEPKGKAVMSSRLYSWLALHYGTMDMAYEVNDRDPNNRLPLERLQLLGSLMAWRFGDWMMSDSGEKRHQQAQMKLQERLIERKKYFEPLYLPRSEKGRKFDLLLKGF